MEFSSKLILIGLTCDFIGVLFVGAGLLSGRKGSMITKNLRLDATKYNLDKNVEFYEKHMGHIENYIVEVNEQREKILKPLMNKNHDFESRSITKDFWAELIGILFLLAGFFLQALGTIQG